MGSSVEQFLQKTGGQSRLDTSGTMVGRFLENEDELNRLKASRLGQSPPDSAARILKLEARTGLPTELIERNLDSLEAQTARPDFDPERFRRESPIMASWLAEHPKHLSLASDDLTRLSWLERQWRSVKDNFNAGRATTELSDIGTKAMLGNISATDRKRQLELEQKIGLGSVAAEAYDINGIMQVPGAVAQQLPIFARTAAVGGAGAAIGFAAARGTGAKIGWRVASGAEAGRMEASLAYLEFEKLRDERGQPLSRNMALGASIIVGVINGGLEMTGFEEMAKNIPGIRSLGKDALKKALAKSTTSAALRRYMENIGSAAVTEGFTEFMQELVTSSVGTLATMEQDGMVAVLTPEEMIDRLFSPDNLARAFQAGKQGAMAGGGMTSVTGAASVTLDVQKARRAKAASQVISDLGRTTTESPMMQRLPDKMQEAVERLAKDGQVETLYAPLTQWREYWQSKQIDPAQAAEAVLGPEGAQLYAEAERTDSDLPIPTGRYATTLASTEHHNFFINELRSGPTELSAREAQERLQQLDKEESEAAEAEVDERQVSATKVAERVRGELEQTGQDPKTAATNALLYEQFFHRMSERTGETPEKLFDMFGLKIARVEDATVDPSALNQDLDPDELNRIHISDIMDEDADTTITWHAGVRRHKEAGDLRMWEGGVTMKLDPETMMARITMAMLPKDLQNKGWGTALYRSLIDKAHAEGFRVFSDQIVSDEAQHIYEKLKRIGYAVNDRGYQPGLPGLIEVGPEQEYNQDEVVTELRKLMAGFHSKAEKIIQDKMGNRASIKEVRALLREVKAEEREWLNIDSYLDDLEKLNIEKVEKSDVLAHIESGRLKIVEKRRDAEGVSDEDAFETSMERARENLRTDIQLFVRDFVDFDRVNTPDGPRWFATINRDWNEKYLNESWDQAVSHPWVSEYLVDKILDEANEKTMVGKDSEKFKNVVGMLVLPANDTPGGAQRKLRLELFKHIEEHETDPINQAADEVIDAGDAGVPGMSYESYTLPGGENYREFLLTMPDIEPRYKTAHFEGVQNVILHFRVKDRVDADGGKMFFVEELQSDWHQKGRDEGYGPPKRDTDFTDEERARANILREKSAHNSEGLTDAEEAEYDALVTRGIFGLRDRVPNAPFKTTWHELALKRIIRMAAEGGYDSIGWTTGNQQANRYALDQFVDQLLWEPANSSQGTLVGRKDGRQIFRQYMHTRKELDAHIGVEAAEKLLQAPYPDGVLDADEFTPRVLEGEQLKIGTGGGMRAFYDGMMPQFLSKFVKKYGAKIGMTKTEVPSAKNADLFDGSIEKGEPKYFVQNEGTDEWGAETAITKEEYEDLENRFAAGDKTADRQTFVRTGFVANVHHMVLTPELKQAALNNEFTLFQSDWKHRAVRAKFAGSFPKQGSMRLLPLLEFMNTYKLTPDMLQDVELIITRNTKPGEGKFRATVMLNQKLVEEGMVDEWMGKMMEAMERGEDPDTVPAPPIRESRIALGHIANDKVEELERFVTDLQFSPTEMKQARSKLIHQARTQLADYIEATEIDTVDPENKIIDLQKAFITRHFGETAAADARYAEISENRREGVIVQTRIFDYGLMTSSFEKGKGDVTHEFQSFKETEIADDITEVELFPELDRRDVDGLKILNELRDVLNRGTSAEALKLIVKLDMINEVMRTGLNEYAPQVVAWARQTGELDQSDDSEPKGRIRIGASKIDIELLKKADLSTFIHESAHFFLEVMQELGTEHAEVGKDLATIKHWLGKNDDKPFSRDEHELFARGFERYLLEGKAPVPRLQMAFARFKAWLVGVYQSLTELNVELDDEVRGVFDRMLASQAEIEAARSEKNEQPLFADPKAVGMSDTEAAAYNEAHQAARMAAEEHMTARIIQEFEREKSRVWNAERIKVREEVANEADEDTTMRLWSIIGRGYLPSGAELPPGVEPFKLDRVAVEAQYPPEVVARLSPRLLAKPGGKLQVAHPSLIADIFGFDSAESMLESLAVQEDPKQWIEKTTNSRMRSRRYDGTPLQSMEIPVEARKAVHNEKRAQLLQKELQILAATNLPTMKGLVRKLSRRLPKLQEVRDEAVNLIAAKRIRDIKPDIYRRAESTSAKAAMEAFLKGDIELAFDMKQRELLNHELFRAASDAKDQTTKGVKFMQRLANKPSQVRLAKAGGTYQQQIDKLLERFDFAPATNKEVSARQSLRDFLDEQQALGFQPSMPDEVLNEAFRKHYKELTFTEFSGIVESARLIKHLSTLKNKLLASQKKRSIREAVVDMTSTIEAHHKMKPEPIDLAPDLSSRFKSGVKGLIAAHTKLEFMFEWLDGNKNNGANWGYLFAPLAQAEANEHRMNVEMIPKLREIFRAYPRSERATWFWRKTTVKEVELKMTKANMLAVALNWGNEGNRTALMEGYGWSEKQVQAVLDNLDARDWTTVQRIWDLIDSFWPQIEQLEKDLNGVAPEKVQAIEIVNRHGTFRGGYYPIIFDAQLSWRQGVLDTKRQTAEMFGGQWAKAMTRHGHTKERSNSAGKPIKLDLTPLTEHLTNVVHDLTHRRAVIDISRLSQHEDVRNAIEKSLGREMYRQIHPWLVNVAAGQRTEFYNPIEGLLARGRMGATVVNMGYKMTTALTQVLSFTNSIKELGPKYAALGLSDVWGKPWKMRESWDFVVSRSAFMDQRITSYDRDVRDALSNMNVAGVKPGPLSIVTAYTGPVRDSFFMFIGLMDMAVSLPTWLGAYRRAMDGEAEGINSGDEEAAVGYADKIVRETQGVGAPKDMSAVQRGPEAYKLFTMFYSYFSVLFNQFAKSTNQLHLDKNVARYAASLALLWFIPAALQDLLLDRGPGEDDDEEEWYKWLLTSEAKYPFQTIIILRDIINGMDRFGYEPSAGLEMFGSIAATLRASGKLMTEEEITRGEVKNAAMAAGYVTKLPSRQLWQTGEYFYDWMNGNVYPDNPLDAAWRALVTGAPKDE